MYYVTYIIAVIKITYLIRKLSIRSLTLYWERREEKNTNNEIYFFDNSIVFDDWVFEMCQYSTFKTLGKKNQITAIKSNKFSCWNTSKSIWIWCVFFEIWVSLPIFNTWWSKMNISFIFSDYLDIIMSSAEHFWVRSASSSVVIILDFNDLAFSTSDSSLFIHHWQYSK